MPAPASCPQAPAFIIAPKPLTISLNIYAFGFSISSIFRIPKNHNGRETKCQNHLRSRVANSSQTSTTTQAQVVLTYYVRNCFTLLKPSRELHQISPRLSARDHSVFDRELRPDSRFRRRRYRMRAWRFVADVFGERKPRHRRRAK